MKDALRFYEAELNAIREAGTYKDERIITTPQRSRIDTTKADGVLNLCANNYLGLADSAELIAAAKASYDRWGFGLASVRFICGTQDLHRELETRLANFLGMEDAILYSSCFDANGGLFETLLGPEDAVISDELNHASIIDGVRLCKACLLYTAAPGGIRIPDLLRRRQSLYPAELRVHVRQRSLYGFSPRLSSQSA